MSGQDGTSQDVSGLGNTRGVVRGFEDPAWLRWLAGENGGLFVVADKADALPIGRSMLGALIVLAAYTAATFALAIASFRARDVP